MEVVDRLVMIAQHQVDLCQFPDPMPQRQPCGTSKKFDPQFSLTEGVCTALQARVGDSQSPVQAIILWSLLNRRLDGRLAISVYEPLVMSRRESVG